MEVETINTDESCKIESKSNPIFDIDLQIFENFPKPDPINFKSISNYESYIDSKGFFDLREYLISDTCEIDELFLIYCKLECLDVIKFLSKYYSKCVIFESKILYNAAFTGNLRLIKILEKKFNKFDRSRIALATIKDEHFDVFKYLINSADCLNSDLVVCSASYGKVKFIKYLVGLGMEFDIFSVLKAAAENNRLVTVKYLTTNFNYSIKNIEDVCIDCCRLKYLRIVKYLTQNFRFKLYSLGCCASKCGNIKIIKYLVTICPALLCNQLLINSAICGHLNIVEYLVSNGVPVTLNTFKYSAYHGHLNIITYLVELGTKFNLSTAFYDAARKGHTEIINYLYEKYAFINITISKETLAHRIIPIAAEGGHLQTVNYLLQSYPGIDCTEALIEAAKRNRVDIVQCLVEKGTLIDINILHNAIYECKSQLVKYLLGLGMVPEKVVLPKHSIPGYFETVVNLIEADIQVKDNIALIDAVLMKKIRLVKKLVVNGTKINDTNALAISVSKNYRRITKYLLNEGAKLDDSLITSSDNSINRILYKYSKESQKSLFHPDIVNN